MRGKSSKWLTGIAAVMALAIWWRLREAPPTAPVPTSGASNAVTPAAASLSNPPISAASPKPGLIDAFSAAAAQLKNAPDAAARKKALEELRQALAAGSTNEVSAAIRRFLDSKADAPTGLGFKIGAHGALTEAPTLRTYLLDYLGQIDPAVAADYAKVILASMDSPDEWAVALRNLANGDSSDAGHALLAQKTAQMLQYAPWQQNPSTGYLEAFDAAVYLGGTDLLPTLSGLVRQQDNPAVAHASFLAMDRLVINNTATVLSALQASPDLMAGRESTRADYFARADVRDPQQRQVLESYLLNPAISAAEINTFAGVYPNANYMLSPNLLTQNSTPDHDTLISRDAQSLAVAQQWMADPRFSNLGPALQKIKTRLQNFVQQASQAH
jgi:hypothetical protein